LPSTSQCTWTRRGCSWDLRRERQCLSEWLQHGEIWACRCRQPCHTRNESQAGCSGEFVGHNRRKGTCELHGCLVQNVMRFNGFFGLPSVGDVYAASLHSYLMGVIGHSIRQMYAHRWKIFDVSERARSSGRSCHLRIVFIPHN